MDDYIRNQIDVSTRPLEEWEESHSSHVARYGWYLKWLRPYFDVDYRYLDIGCRDGEFLVQLGEMTGAWKFWGVELHEELALIAGDRGIAVHIDDIHNIPLPDDFFDFVFMAHLLEHTHDPDKVLWQAERITKPGGKVFIEVPLEPPPKIIPTIWGHWYTFQNPQMLFDLIGDQFNILKQEVDPKKGKWFRVLIEKKE